MKVALLLPNNVRQILQIMTRAQLACFCDQAIFRHRCGKPSVESTTRDPHEPAACCTDQTRAMTAVPGAMLCAVSHLP